MPESYERPWRLLVSTRLASTTVFRSNVSVLSDTDTSGAAAVAPFAQRSATRSSARSGTMRVEVAFAAPSERHHTQRGRLMTGWTQIISECHGARTLRGDG